MKGETDGTEMTDFGSHRKLCCSMTEAGRRTHVETRTPHGLFLVSHLHLSFFNPGRKKGNTWGD